MKPEHELLGIIQQFRNTEISFPSDHVERWIRQFNPGSRDVVLEETLHILKKWYFSVDSMREFVFEVYEHVLEAYQDKNDIIFWNNQEHGESQKRINKLLPQECCIGDICKKHIVYIDDGIYTGATVKKDIQKITLLCTNNKIETIDIFTLIAYSNGLEYIKKEFEKLSRKTSVKINIYRKHELFNDKQTTYYPDCEEYTRTLDVLWPISDLRNMESVRKYEEYFANAHRTMHLAYRTHGQNYSSSIYSSEKNKLIIEREFLLAGLNILGESSYEKGLYPLGFNNSPAFGFGSFCANAFNISNTCPVVLWWGTDTSIWYPLLPRRIS